ncbi:hypothetical protein SAMN05216576_107160 [Ectopseudomonas chengduensis]|uniref:Uncharacterized protein n=1 Tax=Ectopseudomonas chengduensis TaxID=489632 RepID=A0A1G6PY88_9GAMM|nr:MULTISPECIES: hypothetical protein [Pseudomonas]MBP3061990.1 hypothetical protein [Pseudomonas chengduensis]NNB75284.1 hypothetical protein [Pseudomonas chengduensis]OEO24476.1 hypothetical protein AX279_17560 [Pseudomonas sp. J237]SDC85172.1 hypothetical protein SAMN05216576_107160 [Pseudomonas chengduensis]
MTDQNENASDPFSLRRDGSQLIAITPEGSEIAIGTIEEFDIDQLRKAEEALNSPPMTDDEIALLDSLLDRYRHVIQFLDPTDADVAQQRFMELADLCAGRCLTVDDR